ncbi:MAG: CBS domain-containing protein [Candidatus Thorarchaeota archaeon]|nr:CBS domain-containing protein [Candidatus Thorarchaeota archaeon]
MKVKDFMTNILVTADEDTLVSEAAKLMAAEDIGSLIITRQDEMVGIVTQRDIIAAHLLSADIYEGLQVKDIMMTQIVTIDPDADLWQALALMDQTGKKHIPVVAGNDTIGVVSATDIIRVLATMKIIAEGAEDQD